MLRSKALLLALVLGVLPLAVTYAAPPPPCTCELCLADPGVKCNQQQNGSCVHLLRSGVCLGLFTDLATTPMTSPAAETAAPTPEPPAAATPVAPSLEPIELAPTLCPPDEECIPQCLQCTTDPQCQQLCPSGVGRCVQSSGCCMCMIS